MKIEFKGNELNFNLSRSNLRKQAAKGSIRPGTSEEDMPDSLVWCDKDTNTITVDESASDSYATYAAIHECICCGSYKGLFPDPEDPERRCGLIDKMLIQAMPESERKTYIAKRIEMFRTLIEHGLNPQYDTQFLKSIETLESL